MPFIVDPERRGCCSTPPDASEIRTAPAPSTRSHVSFHGIKLVIYCGQAYEKQRKAKATFKAEAGPLHCKILNKAAMGNNMLAKYAGFSSGVAFRTAWPSPLGFKAFLSCSSFPVEQYQIVDKTSSLRVEVRLRISTNALALCTFQAARFSPTFAFLRGTIIKSKKTLRH